MTTDISLSIIIEDDIVAEEMVNFLLAYIKQRKEHLSRISFDVNRYQPGVKE
jgi:hypothetical protein